MTKTTEELKREMYEALDVLKYAIRNTPKPMLVGLLESATEKYLEALRQDLKTSHEATGELAIQLSEMTTQRDELRNKLQAFEFANKSAGELLRDALATVKRQRQFIRTLYTSRKARKIVGSTSGQKKSQNVPRMKCAAFLALNPRNFAGLIEHEMGKDQKCIHCGDFVIRVMS